MAESLTRWHPFADLAEVRTCFDRMFDEMGLPKGVKPDDIEANCEDGVCEVTIPHPKGVAEKKAVAIKPKAA